MMTLKTIIGLISSESKDYVGAEERLNEEEAAVEYEHSKVDIDLPISSWLSGCTSVRKPLSDFRMGSCFDFGLHGSSAATTTATFNKRNIEQDIIASPVSSPSLSLRESKSASSELATDKPQEDENAREKIEREERSLALEKTYVYDVYDQIAPYLRDSRNRTWPKINEFLLDLDPGSLICDAGCGSGKYLDKNSEIFALGLDRCQNLAELAREKGHEVVTCDILSLPFREESFDAAISISVIHHLSTTERRIEAIKELARVLRIGGRLIITVWAMEQKHRKFESQDVLVPWHKPVRVSSEDQTSIEKDMTSTTTNSEEDILNYHAYTSGSEPSVLSFPIRKRPKFRESWLNRHRFSEGRQLNRRSSSQSSSDLSSPNESCYSFLRRALQKLSWGSGESYKANNPNSWLNPGINSIDQFGSLNNFENECLNISANDCQIETRNRLNAELDKQDSLDSNENADDIPIELYDVDGDHSYQVPPEVSRIRQRRGTFSSDNNDSFKRRISQSFERTASLKDSVLNRRRNRSLKVRLKRSASTDSPNSHSVAPKSRSLSDLLNLFSATFLQYSRKTSQDTTSGSSSSFTKHSSNSSVDSKGSRTVPLSKSNIFTLAKVEEGNENYSSHNNAIVHNNNDELAKKKESTCTSGNETKLVVKLTDKVVEKRTCHALDRKVRPRSLILNRERRLTTIPRTLSMEDYQNGNHILLDYDTDFCYQSTNLDEQPISLVKKTRDMSTQFDYLPAEETKKTCKYFDNDERRDSDPKDYVKLRKNRNLSGRLTKSESAVDNRFIDRIINRDHLFPSHSMPNLYHFQSSDSNPDARKRDSFVLLSSKAKFLMEMTSRHSDNSYDNRYSFNIKGFRRLSQPCTQLNSNTRADFMHGKSGNCDNDSQSKCSSRWASLLRRHSSFSVMKQCHMQQVIKHSYSTGDSTFAESGETIGESSNQYLTNNHSNNKFIKEDSLQSDTSVDSDDSVASVIAVRHKSTDVTSRASSVKRNSLCSITKSSSKEGSDTSFDSEESCVSVIANETLAVVKAQLMEECEANDVITKEIDVKWEKYMDASESLALDSIFYVNIVHQPDMETIMKEDDYYLPRWINSEFEDFDYDIVGVAAVEYHNTAEKLSLAETCWLDSSSSCKSGDHDEDLLERRLQLDINCSLDLYQTSSNNDDVGSSVRLLDAAVDVANSLQSAVEVAVVSNRKCNEASIDFSSIVTICNQKLIMEDVTEEDICENNEMNNSLTNIEMSMSISHEEADFYVNEEPEVIDSFEESQWRVREDVINGNISQANLKLFQKMLRNANNETPSCRSSRNKTSEQKKHRRKSDSEAGSERCSASTIFAPLSKCKNSESSAIISRGKSLDFYVVTDQSMFKETRRPSAILDLEESDRLTKYLESSDNNFFTSKDEMEGDGFSEKGRKRLKSQNNVSDISVAAHSDDQAWQMAAEKSSGGKSHHQDTLSVSTSEDSILSGSENCGSTSHHRYYHVFREGELDYLIENYVENLHIISSYYDHSNWCVIAEKVQVWKI